MKPRHIFLKTISLSIIVFATSCMQQPVDVSTEISKANKVFIEAFNNGEMNTVSQMFTEHGKLFPSNFDAISGRDNIELFCRRALERGIKKIQLETVSAERHGNIVVEEGRYTLYTNDNIILDEGKSIVTWKKVDNNWLINRYIWTSNNAFAGGHNLQKGHILGIHTLEITLKEGVTFSDFEKFYKENYIPAFESSFSGIQLYLLKGVRGENMGKYSELYFIRSKEEGDYYEPEAGSLSEKGLEAWELLKPTQEKLDNIVKTKRVYTDWRVQ